MRQLPLGLEHDEQRSPKVGLAPDVQAQLVMLMAQCLLALLVDTVDEEQRGERDD